MATLQRVNRKKIYQKIYTEKYIPKNIYRKKYTEKYIPKNIYRKIYILKKIYIYTELFYNFKNTSIDVCNKRLFLRGVSSSSFSSSGTPYTIRVFRCRVQATQAILRSSGLTLV